MIHDIELEKMKKDAVATCELKLKCCLKGHDHVVNSTVVDNFKLIEMITELQNFRKKSGPFEGINE